MKKLRAKKIKHLEGKKVFLVFRVRDGEGIRLVATRLNEVFNDEAIFEGNCHVWLGNIIRLVHRAQGGNSVVFSRDYKKEIRADVEEVMRRLSDGVAEAKEVEIHYIKDGESKTVRGILDKAKYCGFVGLEDGTLIHFLSPGEAICSIDFIEQSEDPRYPWHVGCYQVPSELIPNDFNVTNPDLVDELRQTIFFLDKNGISVLSRFSSRPELMMESLSANREIYSVRVVPETVE